MLTVTPAIVTIANVGAGPVAVNVTTDQVGPITATLAETSFVTIDQASLPAPGGTINITPIDRAGGDNALTIFDGLTTVVVPIALGASILQANPKGKTFAQAAAYIRIIADAPTYPSDTGLGILLNEALAEVGDAIDQVLNTVSLMIAPGSATMTLPADILDIVRIGFSPTLPGIPGNIPYELVEIGMGEFMDFNAGVSSSFGITPGGAVLYYTRLSDSFGRIRLQFAPSLPAGFINVTYHPRVSIFDSANVDSTISLDPSYFELAAQLTAEKITLSQRDNVRAEGFRTRYERLLARKKESVGRRNAPRTSVVRDVTSNGYNAMPTWWPS